MKRSSANAQMVILRVVSAILLLSHIIHTRIRHIFGPTCIALHYERPLTILNYSTIIQAVHAHLCKSGPRPDATSSRVSQRCRTAHFRAVRLRSPSFHRTIALMLAPATSIIMLCTTCSPHGKIRLRRDRKQLEACRGQGSKSF